MLLQRGGVGFYPGSANQFVHMDTGSVRHWPKVSRDYLARLFPDGRTVHIRPTAARWPASIRPGHGARPRRQRFRVSMIPAPTRP